MVLSSRDREVIYIQFNNSIILVFWAGWMGLTAHPVVTEAFALYQGMLNLQRLLQVAGNGLHGFNLLHPHQMLLCSHSDRYRN